MESELEQKINDLIDKTITRLKQDIIKVVYKDKADMLKRQSLEYQRKSGGGRRKRNSRKQDEKELKKVKQTNRWADRC